MYKKSTPSRLSYIFSIIAWSIIVSSCIIFFNQVEHIGNWTPSGLARIDTLGIVFTSLATAAFINSIISWIFREIRHSGVIENIIVRRFLPIIRFFIIAGIWFVTLFQILEKLNIDTRSILTGAGIGGAILAFAAKDVMTNLFGSLSILLGRIFDIGEDIRIRMRFGLIHEGTVEEITLNYTKLTKTTGEVIYIPNRTVYTEVVENISRERYCTYTYIIPFSKATSNARDIKQRLRIIEGKLSQYNPLLIEWETENTNAGDFTYKVSVQFPEENTTVDTEIRLYLTEHIFRG